MNKFVARLADGGLIKGATFDFSPAKEAFHITEPAPNPGANSTLVHTGDLKALFFVRDFDGDPDYVEEKEFSAPLDPSERRIGVTFRDGETLVGTTPMYRPALPGFFLVPADPRSNNERCYVVEAATREVRLL